MKHKKLLVIPIFFVTVIIITCVYPFNLYIDQYSGDASPVYSITVYLVIPINRQADPDTYRGQTLVYTSTWWHQCANRYETSYSDGPTEFENVSYEISHAAIGKEVAKLHYDNFESAYSQPNWFMIIIPIIGIAIGAIGMLVGYSMFHSKTNNTEETRKDQQ